MPSGGITIAPRPERKAPIASAWWDTKRIIAVAACALVLVFLAGWVGYGVHAATHPTRSVRVSRVFTGTVSLVNDPGNAGCVQPASGKAVCSVFFSPTGQPVKKGAQVRVALEWAYVGSSGYDLLLIYPST